MAEPAMTPRAPLGAALPEGRHGDPDGPPGVTLTERASLAAAALAARLREGFGLELPLRPGRTTAGSLALLWTGPGQWLATDEAREGLARFAFAQDWAAALAGLASVTDLTGARAVLRIAGPAAAATLGKLVPIDLDEAGFGPGAAALTLAGHVGVALWRLPGAVPAYEIACYRSFGASLAEAVLDAAAEFGCAVTPARWSPG